MDRCLKRGQAGSGRSDDNEESLKKRYYTVQLLLQIYFLEKNTNIIFDILDPG